MRKILGAKQIILWAAKNTCEMDLSKYLGIKDY